MPENTSTVQSSTKPMGFYRTASFKMKRKVKTISKALTFKKKSWDIETTVSKKNKQDSDSYKVSSVDLTGSDESSRLLEVFDEVVESVLETSRNLATEIEKLDNTPSRVRPVLLRPAVDHKENELPILSHTENFDALDDTAVKVSEQSYETYDDMVRDLTSGCENQLETARALFRWVVAAITSDKACLPGVSKHDNNASPHHIFRDICSLADLDCRIILGWSKSGGYRPNMPLDKSAFRNSWTAVCIDGRWRFVNCAWAARHVASGNETVHRLDDFYFLTDPKEHIYQHFPDDPEWQLLDTPLSLDEFRQLPVLKPAFFRHNVALAAPHTACISAESNVVELRLTQPEVLRFGIVLECHKDGRTTRIKNSVLQRVIQDNVIFLVTLPGQGRYYLSVFVGEYWNSDCLETACSFVIDFNCVGKMSSAQLQTPFPPVSTFGPTPAMASMGASTEIFDPLIKLTGSVHDLNFSVTSALSLTHSFQFYDNQSGSLVDIDRFAFLTKRTENTAKYTLACSQRGYFVFSLYGSTDPSVPLDCLYSCLVVCDAEDPATHRFPTAHSKWIDCTLYSPLCGDLQSKCLYKFKLDVSSADKVYVSLGGIKQHLTRSADGKWEGDVQIGSASSDVRVMAVFMEENSSSPVSCLLDFGVVDQKETTV